MKQIILTSVTVLLILFSGCKKNTCSGPAVINPSIVTARNYFEKYIQPLAYLSSSPRFIASRKADWGRASVITCSSTKAVIVPVLYLQAFYIRSTVDVKRFYYSNEITWLCMYTDPAGKYHTEQVAFFPDSNYKKNGKFTGLISIDSWQGVALKKYILEGNNSIYQWTGDTTTPKNGSIKENGTAANMAIVTQTCYTIEEYIYAADDPDNGTYKEEPAGCSYSITGDNDGSDGLMGADYGSVTGGGGSISPANSFTVLNGNNIIGNIIDYNKCFTNIAGSGNTYSVTVCVDQPEPGSREPWVVSGGGTAGSSSGANPADVGHTFLIFTQKTGTGIITRNIGFYPGSSVNPWSPSSQGQLNNDAGHGYNVSLTVTVNNSQFFNMLNYVAQGNNAGYQYNLNSNNCTSFTLHTLSAGNVTLPSTIGSWPNGSGNDPGDLGQDIQAMSLTSGMTRSNTENAHPNTGNCN
jgi:hypothetical protein